MKKYVKITYNDVLKVFEPNRRLFQYQIISELKTSRYQVIKILEDLMDDDKIEKVKKEPVKGLPLPVYYYQLKI